MYIAAHLIYLVSIVLVTTPTPPSTGSSKTTLPPYQNWEVAYVDFKTDNLCLAHEDGSKRIVIAKGGNHPSWSPDGSRLAFYKGSSVFIRDMKTGKTHVVFSSKDLEPGRLSFDPKYPILDVPFGGGIKLVGLDKRENGSFTGQHRRGFVNAVAWSPSGRKMLFTSDGDIWLGERQLNLNDLLKGYRLKVSYVDAIRLAPLAFFFDGQGGSVSTPFWVDDLAWFPDEKSLVFHYQRQGGGGVSNVGFIDLTPVSAPKDMHSINKWFNSLSGYKIKIRWLDDSASGPAICPDGLTVSVSKDFKGSAVGEFGLVLIDKAGNNLKSLIPEAEQAAWRPISSSKRTN